MVDEIINISSSWEKFKKFIAWMLRYRAILLCQANIRTHSDTSTRNQAAHIVPLTVEEIENAEKNIIKAEPTKKNYLLFGIVNVELTNRNLIQ